MKRAKNAEGMTELYHPARSRRALRGFGAFILPSL
jgi:hypothetical protein